MSHVLDIVREVGEIHFEGNIIPHEWYKHVLYKNGKPALPALVILAEIVYWYRPVIEKDEHTGRVIGFHKRFAADKLQRANKSFMVQFGITQQQTRDSIDLLEEIGVITTELRNISLPNGTVLRNVQYIEVVPERLRAISRTSGLKTGRSGLGVSDDRSTDHTNTETTRTEIDAYKRYETPGIDHMFESEP